FAVHAGGGVDLPDHGAAGLGNHAAFGDVAVGADAHVQEAAIGTGGHRLGPVVVDLGRELGERFRRRGAGLGRARAVVEAHHGILVGDVQVVADQREAIRGVEVLGEHRLHFVVAVAVGIAQQGQAVAALDLGGAGRLD